MDFIGGRSLFDYAPNANILIEQIIHEGNGRQLFWETRTTKFAIKDHLIFLKLVVKMSHLLEKSSVAVDEFYAKFSNETNSFIKFWPRKYKCVGWYNRLLNGYQQSYIHVDGC